MIVIKTIFSSIIVIVVCFGLINLVQRILRIKNEYNYYKEQKEDTSNAYITRKEKYSLEDRLFYGIPQESFRTVATYFRFNELPSLPIERFIKFYSVDPSKWKLKKGCAYRKDDSSVGIFFRPFWNYHKYEIFRTATEKEYEKMAKEKADRENAIKQDKKLEALLKLVQNDIDKTVEKVNEELRKTVELTNQVEINLKEKE